MKVFIPLGSAGLMALTLNLFAQAPIPPPSSRMVTGATSNIPQALPDGVFRFGGAMYVIKHGTADLIHRKQTIGKGLVAEENGRVSVNGAPAFELADGQHVGMDGKLSPGPFDTAIPGIMGSPKATVGGDKDPSSGAPMPKASDTPRNFRKDSTGNAPSSPEADKK